MTTIKEIKLYNADSLAYSGSMIVDNGAWKYSEEVDDKHLREVTSGLPLKAALSCLISFNLVYDIIE